MNGAFSFIKQNPIAHFLTSAFALFISWLVIYELWIGPNGSMDLWLVNNLTFLSAHLLELCGYELIEDNFPDIRTLGIDGGHLLWIGNPCNGLTVFALFSGFIIAYPGKILKKLWYIPTGILLMHALNVLRVAALCVIVKYYPNTLEFNHTFTFQIIVYGFMFALWYLWATKLSR